VPGRIERWPLDVRGYVTRGTTAGAPADPAAEPHEGLDIAVPTGTLVRAAGAAVVARAGTDSVFGRHALLAHADGYTTLYAHLARLVVRAGVSLLAVVEKMDISAAPG
jgi:murein DD-endopeptidase MepM/ murein hydrolase activator NlpD